MSVRSVTTTTWTCDLCGKSRNRDDLLEFRNDVDDGPYSPRSSGTPRRAHVCHGCMGRPVRDLAVRLYRGKDA